MSRKSRAASLIEMVVGLMIAIPIILTLIDFIMMTLAVQFNDSAAREADRLAASGDPVQAVSRAQTVVNRLNQSMSGYVSNCTLLGVTFTPSNMLATEASMVPYGGVVQGTVTVKTQVTVTPFLIRYFYPGPYNFVAAQTCPITYNIPNTAGGQPVPP